jgi:hypothetical protein
VQAVLGGRHSGRLAMATRTRKKLERSLLEALPPLGAVAGLVLVPVQQRDSIAATAHAYIVHALVGAVLGAAFALLLIWATRHERAQGTGRRAIPERVRHEVWRRDRARCVDCGSRARLEFDHIIPVSRGGSNTARNIELRCEGCNRRKGARV